MIRQIWTHQATRLYRRYQVEVVEALNLCPWAERSFARGHVKLDVQLQTDASAIDAPLASIRNAEGDVVVEVLILLFPRIVLDLRSFDRFVSALRAAHVAAHAIGEAPFVFATFHPEAMADCSEPSRLVPFLRRTPDPTIQVVRRTTLDRIGVTARSGGTHCVDIHQHDASAHTDMPGANLREQIAAANLATVERVGLAMVSSRLADIRRDRDATYTRVRQLEVA